MLGRNGTDRPQPRARSRSVRFALPTSVPGRLLEARVCGCLATSVRASISPVRPTACSSGLLLQGLFSVVRFSRIRFRFTLFLSCGRSDRRQKVQFTRTASDRGSASPDHRTFGTREKKELSARVFARAYSYP